jgi:hypothetical protein
MRTGRLVLFGLLWLVLMHLGCALAALLVYWEQAGWPTLGRLRNPAYTRYEAPLVARIILYPSGGRRGVMGMGFPLWDMVFAGFVVMALTPVVFMVLGETLSRARVRRRHILRGLCYAPPWLSLAAAPLVVVLIVGYVDLLFSLRLGRITGSVMQLVVPASLGLAAAGHIWWWRCFARGYLRINHTWPVAVLAVLVACLATPVLCWVLPEAIGLRIGW